MTNRFEYISFYKISKYKNTVFDISKHIIQILKNVFSLFSQLFLHGSKPKRS